MMAELSHNIYILRNYALVELATFKVIDLKRSYVRLQGKPQLAKVHRSRINDLTIRTLQTFTNKQ